MTNDLQNLQLSNDLLGGNKIYKKFDKDPRYTATNIRM